MSHGKLFWLLLCACCVACDLKEAPQKPVNAVQHQSLTAPDLERVLRVGMTSSELITAVGEPNHRLEFPDHEMFLYEVAVEDNSDISGYTIDISDGRVLNWAPVLLGGSTESIREPVKAMPSKDPLVFRVENGSGSGSELVLSNFTTAEIVEKRFAQGAGFSLILGLGPSDRRAFHEFTRANVGKNTIISFRGREVARIPVDHPIDSDRISIYSPDQAAFTVLLRQFEN